jgi:hypothetical protein
MHYKPIENCHMENVVLGKDLNLGMIGSFFHAFTHGLFLPIVFLKQNCTHPSYKPK